MAHLYKVRLIGILMKYFLFIFTAFVLFLAQKAQAQNAPTFPAGEKLTYNVSFATFTDAASIEIYAAGKEKLNDREVNVVRAKVRTTGMVQATLIDLNNDYTTFLSPETGLPARVEKFLRDDGKNTEIKRDFAENQTASELNVHDLFSAFYQMRRMDFANTTPQPIRVWENEKTYLANLQVVGREHVSTATGAFNAFVVQLNTDDKNFNRYKTKIYFSDDERRVPVMFRLKMPQGELRAELISLETILTEPVAVVPTPQPTPVISPTPRLPRPTPTPKPYVENVPLDADLPFALGEKLTFEVIRGGQNIGTVNFEVKERKLFNNRDSVLLSATSQTGSGIFAATDKIESYIDPNYLVPYRQEIRLSGGLAGYNQTINFNQELGFAVNEKGLRTEMPVGTHDALSFVYALRAFRFTFGQKNAYDTRAAVFLGDAPIVVTLTPTREMIDFNGKKVNTIALTMRTGNPQIDSLNFRLWLTEDSRRLPLRLIFNTPLGAIQANLTAAK